LKDFRRILCVLLCALLLPAAFFPVSAEEPEPSAPTVRVLLRRLNLTDRIDLQLRCGYLASWGKDSRMPPGVVQVRKDLEMSLGGANRIG